MELYDKVGFASARFMTTTYSTSFSLATRLLPKHLRCHVYNLYGLVRLADEVTDTYRGENALELLDRLEQEVYKALASGYSTNVIVQAFTISARQYGIDTSLIKPFFASMRMDIEKMSHYSVNEYDTYIFGSAEVVGLMCLRVFCEGDERRYEELRAGARALGAAFQKVNFLRDVAADNTELQRAYFPGVRLHGLTEQNKENIIADIKQDFAAALPSIKALPKVVRPAVMTAYNYYRLLLGRIGRTPASILMARRVRVSNFEKIVLLLTTTVSERVKGLAR